MKLYIAGPSPNSLRVQAVANHVDIDLELINVDLLAGEHLEGELAKINPNHKIPTLVDGDFVLWESTAIMLYLAAGKPEAGLIPDDPKLQAKMQQWLSWNTAHFSRACGAITWENLVKKHWMKQEVDADALKQALEEFNRFAAVLDAHLADNNYLLGDNISVADHATVSFLVHAEAGDIPVKQYPHIQRWQGGLLGSAAWQKTLQVLQ
ncbi:MAG: glutathione S-transferase family protein [Gammaproteobacteria bacterium]